MQIHTEVIRGSRYSPDNWRDFRRVRRWGRAYGRTDVRCGWCLADGVSMGDGDCADSRGNRYDRKITVLNRPES
jgi:hypothetical protein